ncbi:MAG: hypothetical protein IJB96_03830 [Lachnospira sp.]|nr:hypothetical protein [Lachnospira sp.]
MGVVRMYACGCGYSKEICVGSGMGAFNINLVKRLFPQEAAMIDVSRGPGEFELANAVGECLSCKKLYATAMLTYKGGVATKPCPDCGKPLMISDINNVNCPVCSELMNWQEVGLWD